MAIAYHSHHHHHLLLQPLSLSSFSRKPLFFSRDSPKFNYTLKPRLRISKRSLRIYLALAESDSSKSSDNPDSLSLLQELADSFDLPPDYFAQLPRDLRLDLNDAAFDLSNGPVIDECGLELGETLLNLSRAWELADTSTSSALAKKLPLMGSSVTNSAKSALGKRLISAGRRFQSIGQYGQGEFQRDERALVARKTNF